MLVLSSCSSSGKKPDKLTQNGPVELKLGIKKGQVSKTFYHSNSAVEDFEDGQKVRFHEESTDFLEATEIIDARENQLVVRTQTLEKDGTGSLHDFAFPEMDEQIDFVYSRDAKVLRAGPYPKESIFYLPPLSLPDHPVDIGDTWEMNHVWVSSNDGLPLHLNMVTIFKDVVSCGSFGRCADFEVSGLVDILSEKLNSSAKFDSHMSGRILFSLDRGDVIWSEVRSEEHLKSKSTEMKVKSCMSSQMRSEKGVERVTCQPSDSPIQIPKI
jgi:hypothetical protein